jgi:XTP/dITP diphosphohydrolase
VAATSNKGKQKEFARILAPFGIEVILPPQEMLDEIIENGKTFEENAFIKAQAILQKTGLSVVADDSGLCVDALNGRPGVFSARYLGENTPYSKKIEGLLKELEGIPESRRTARFVCAIVFLTPTESHVFTGVCEGVIGHQPKGMNGFGYDPVFYVGSQSFGEMTDDQKDAVSHRGKALQAMCRHLQKTSSSNMSYRASSAATPETHTEGDSE